MSLLSLGQLLSSSLTPTHQRLYILLMPTDLPLSDVLLSTVQKLHIWTKISHFLFTQGL